MECPVCFEVYKNPLLLPGCGHTLCSTCADLLVSDGNFLRCPECRLIYQLRRGVKSLPKNVALQRTIDEQMQLSSKRISMCEEHPDDAVSLYCKTCEKAICLKCYFTGTLRRGDTLHTGHQVHTTEDAFTKEKRLLEERCKECDERQKADKQYIKELEGVEDQLKALMDEKLAAIEKNKNDVISKVKQTANKLKFTLKGSIARDQEYLQMALIASKERLTKLEQIVTDATAVLQRVPDRPDVSTLKEAREKLDEVQNAGCGSAHCIPEIDSFLSVTKFDTSLDSCLHDPNMALSYQTEKPRAPSLDADRTLASDTKAFVTVKCDEKIRTNSVTLHYLETDPSKDREDKDWSFFEIPEPPHRGIASAVLTNLQPDTTYKIYAVAHNSYGESPKSEELWLHTGVARDNVQVP